MMNQCTYCVLLLVIMHNKWALSIVLCKMNVSIQQKNIQIWSSWSYAYRQYSAGELYG